MSFYQKVYDFVKTIPPGKVCSYGIVALHCGSPRASRSVGAALHRNPNPGIIPCHRVVFSSGELAKNFAFGGKLAQKELLEKEGIKFLEDGRVDMKKCLWIPF